MTEVSRWELDPMSDEGPRIVPIVTWYYEMLDPSELRPSPPPRVDQASVERLAAPDANLSRAFYEHVGRDWSWVGRLGWTDDEWADWVCRPGYEMWIIRLGDVPAGYLELDGDPEGDVQIAYFGLLPRYIGRGLGGQLLTAGVRRAWDRGASRVWLHTCSMDGPHARANYEARGFRHYRTVSEQLEIPPDPDALRVANLPGT